jgi:hypothetical protein
MSLSYPVYPILCNFLPSYNDTMYPELCIYLWIDQVLLVVKIYGGARGRISNLGRNYSQLVRLYEAGAESRSRHEALSSRNSCDVGVVVARHGLLHNAPLKALSPATMCRFVIYKGTDPVQLSHVRSRYCSAHSQA